jgi:hypothetical protein
MCHIVELTEVAAVAVMVISCVGIAAIVRMMANQMNPNG